MQHHRTDRLPGLDGLRGVAVLLVLLFHVGYFLVPSVDAGLLPGGFLGVDLFFVLSGFLMTNILLSRPGAYGRFYKRRVARIFPALLVFLAVQCAYTVATGSSAGGYLRAYGLIALGMGNWGHVLGVSLPFGLGQTWSLGVEEQLYLLWPLVLALYSRRDPRRVGRLCLAGVVLAFAVKLLMFRAGVATPDIYGQTEGRLDDFLVGAFVATLWVRGAALPRRFGPATAVAGTVVAAGALVAHPFTDGWMYEGGYTAVAVSCGVVLYACLHRGAGTGWTSMAWLRAVGRYSFAVYLWHPLVFLAATRAFPDDVVVRVPAAAAALVVLSVGSTRLVEEPLRRWAAALPDRRIALAPA